MHPNPTQLFAAGLSMLKGHEMVKDGNQSKWFWWTVGMIPVNLIAPQMFNIDAEHDKTKQNRSTLLSIHKCIHTYNTTPYCPQTRLIFSTPHQGSTLCDSQP
jgi:hypothetical protein